MHQLLLRACVGLWDITYSIMESWHVHPHMVHNTQVQHCIAQTCMLWCHWYCIVMSTSAVTSQCRHMDSTWLFLYTSPPPVCTCRHALFKALEHVYVSLSWFVCWHDICRDSVCRGCVHKSWTAKHVFWPTVDLVHLFLFACWEEGCVQD